MYIEIVPNRNSRPAVLLREGWREGRKVHKRTVANLTDWPKEQVESLRRLLRGERLVAAGEVFVVEQSLPHGHVEAVLGTVRKLGLDQIIASKPSRERALVLAVLIEQLIHPSSKLGTTRLWSTTTLSSELGVEDADEDDVYAAMDWLLARQTRIEKKLARRHFGEGAQVLYDVTSSYYEGRHCLLARFGHNRDKKKGKRIIVYGVLTDEAGCPTAVQVYPGNTGDPSTVPDQVEKLRRRFGLQRIVLVGDRGMLTQTQIEKLKDHPELGWVSALRFSAIRKLADDRHLQLSLFDQQNLAEITSPEYPGERLVACKNPLLAEERRRKREDLLQATEASLEKIVREVARRTKKPLTKAEIGRKVGRISHRYKMDKHFAFTIEDGVFRYQRREQTIRREAELDGLYVIRTTEPAERLSSEDVVRAYKKLSQVEQLFRTVKGVELLVRPIRHRNEDRVRAHIFLCMLAYYVKWHMRNALAPLLFVDEEIDVLRTTRDPVAPAVPSPSAQRKKHRHRTADDGFPTHSFDTLLAELAMRCRNRCRVKSAAGSPPFYQPTERTPLQERAFELLELL